MSLRTKNQTKTREVARAVVLTALAVALSPFSIPVGPVKIFPAMHFVNVTSAVMLGPLYAVLIAFTTSLLRLALGTGTINAFAGSMIGALLAGLVYRITRNIYLAAAAEVFGTGVLGSLVTVYLVAPTFLNKQLAFDAIFLSFFFSTLAGSVLALGGLKVLNRAGYFLPGSRQTATEQAGKA
jgi:energy coupling factor transporter S component ThiW